MNSIKPTEAIWPDEITHAVLAQLSYDDKCDWLKWAWARMSEAGLVPAHLVTDDPNYVEHVLTLAGLGYRCGSSRRSTRAVTATTSRPWNSGVPKGHSCSPTT